MSDLREVVLQVADAGLRAADPRNAVSRTVSLDRESIIVGARQYRLADFDRVLVLGAGKASLKIGLGLEDVLGDLITDGLIVTVAGEHARSTRFQIATGDHPIPSDASRRAAERLLAFAQTAGSRDLVFACVTGGSSALISRPSDGISFDAKQELHKRLLASGAGIREINTVRKHVSSIKAGRLALAASPATVVNLTICDVAGCAEDLITDPTVADSSTREEAVEVMRAYHLWDNAADDIKRHLLSSSADSPSLDGVAIQTEVIVDGHQICGTMAEAVTALGREPIVLGDSLATDARSAGALVAGMAKTSIRHARPFPARSVLVGCGGESTVTFDSGEALFGSGGPNQELVLSAALELEAGDRVALLAIDTDGHDGGTPHAGAIADGLTASRARAAGVDIRAQLFAHRSASALTALKDHIVTGPTGTNVNDLVVVALGH